MRIGLTYDLKEDYLALGFSPEDAAEFDKVPTIDAIYNALEALGHTPERIGHVHALASRLVKGETWDLVFNIAEGVFGYGREAQIPALLDAYGIPYTFSDPLVLSVALHKGMAKHVAMNQKVPTPAFFVVSQPEDAAAVDLPFPLFCKPVAEGTSKGISDRSLVHSHQELTDVCTRLLEKFHQPVLVEEYLPGREFTVGVVGTGPQARVLGAMEVHALSAGEKASYSFENKQNYYDRVTYALAKDEAGRAAERVALQAWRALECRDGGRVDIRMNAAGEANFIEVNPLAGLHPIDSDLIILCRLLGVSYTELIGYIVESATYRIHTQPQAPKLWFAHTSGISAPQAAPVAQASHSHHAQASEKGKELMLVLHGEVAPGAPPDEQDMRHEAEFAAEMGRALGYNTLELPFITDLTGMKERLLSLEPKLVFNLVETIAGTGRIIELCPALLAQLGIPYTGNPTDATFPTTNTLMAKRLFQLGGIPTAPWAEEADLMADKGVDFPGPYVVKSVWEHASVGLAQDSVVTDASLLLSTVKAHKQRLGGSLFVEQFIDGREFNISLLAGPNGPQVLPPAEIRFDGYPDGCYKIVDYRAKWVEESLECQTTVRSFDFPASDQPLLARLQEVALQCWRVFALAGYARVDFRVSSDGTPYVLEINTNPCLSPDAGFLAACSRTGLTHLDVFRRIIADAFTKSH